MKNKKLFSLLKVLDRAELLQFRRHLLANYGRWEQGLQLTEHLVRHHPDYETTEDQDQKAYHRIFPGEQFDNKKWGNLLHLLHNRLKDFLIGQKLAEDRFEKDRVYLQVLREKHLPEEYQKVLSEMLQRLNQAGKSDMWSHFHRFSLNYLHYYTPADSLRDAGNLVAATQELLTFFAGAQYKLACELMNRRNILDEKGTLNDLEIIREDLEHIASFHHPFADTYRLAFKLLQTNNDSDFQTFRELYFRNRSFLSREDQQILLRYMLNYASARMRDGAAGYAEEALELYLLGLDHRVFIHYDRLSPNIFLNIVELGTLLRGSDWAGQFSEKWSAYLKTGEREGVFQLAQALIAYAREDNEETLLLLRENHKLDRFSKIRRYALLVRVYYDLQEEEALLNQANAFEVFLYRKNNISETILEGYRNFIRLIRLMNKFRGPGRKELLDRLARTSPIYYKSWLTDRINRK